MVQKVTSVKDFSDAKKEESIVRGSHRHSPFPVEGADKRRPVKTKLLPKAEVPQLQG